MGWGIIVDNDSDENDGDDDDDCDGHGGMSSADTWVGWMLPGCMTRYLQYLGRLPIFLHRGGPYTKDPGLYIPG